MTRLAAVAAFVAAAGSTALLALSTAGPAGAASPVTPVPWGTSQALGERCLITHADNSQGACLRVSAAGMMTVDGKTVLGRGAARLLTDEPDADQVARIQVDVTLGMLHAAVASGAANSGTGPKFVQADTTHVAWWTQNCAQRYHVQVRYSARMTDGSLKQGTFWSPWFDTAYAPCAGYDYGAAATGTRCLVRNPDNSLGACIEVRTGLAISHDRGRVFARSTLTLPDGAPNADQVARIQLDRTELKLLSSTSPVLQSSPTVNNNGHAPWSIAAQTVNSQRWVQDAGKPYNCAVSYESITFFSARLTNRTLITGRIVSPPAKAPGC
jgi:hypothetical protein